MEAVLTKLYDRKRGTCVTPIWLDTSGWVEGLLSMIDYLPRRSDQLRPRVIALSSIIMAARIDEAGEIFFITNPVAYNQRGFPVARKAVDNLKKHLLRTGFLTAVGDKAIDGHAQRFRLLMNDLEQGNFERLDKKEGKTPRLVTVRPDLKSGANHKNVDPVRLAKVTQRIADINACYARHAITGMYDKEGPITFENAYTVFNGSLDAGGRLYGSAERIWKEKRGCLRINGERAVWLDVASCFPTLMRCAAHPYDPEDLDHRVELGDLYAQISARLDGALDREQVKTVINNACGNARWYRRWPKGFKVDGMSWQEAETAFLAVIPELSEIRFGHYDWRHLQRYEASIIVDSVVWGLARFRDIPVLSCHDAVVCAESQLETVKQCLLSSWFAGTGSAVEPTIREEWYEES